jgi:hypothetical protein
MNKDTRQDREKTITISNEEKICYYQKLDDPASDWKPLY